MEPLHGRVLALVAAGYFCADGLAAESNSPWPNVPASGVG